jgi:dihydroorotate dehydrogenase
MNPHLLPAHPKLHDSTQSQIQQDFERFANAGLPSDLERYLLDRYGLDVSSTYAGLPLKNPWGKGSGQLSMKPGQILDAATAGLGFVVLKTVIAEDKTGDRSMSAWSIPEAKMVVEPIIGHSGESGWTVTWNGRGWPGQLADYLQLVSEASQIGHDHAMPVIPSVKYHLPGPTELTWRTAEYQHTTQAILEVMSPGKVAIEKDFSPTLAGSDRATVRNTILNWLQTIPQLIRASASNRDLAVVLKLFNAVDDDSFQLDMLDKVQAPDGPDAIVYANRLFNPTKTFMGKTGLAYGGPDLSDRNLRTLSAWRASTAAPALRPISATGNIHSGRLAAEYLLRGCTSFQIHTFFQLPNSEFRMTVGSRLERAIHQLYFDPHEGFVAWMLHLARLRGQGGASVLEMARWSTLEAPTVQDLIG